MPPRTARCDADGLRAQPHGAAAASPQAVVVTTPSNLSTVDVVRGVHMLSRLKVPVLALVENMASFECDCCGTLHFPFGRAHLTEVLASIEESRPASFSDTSGVAHKVATFRLPIVVDSGVTENPHVLAHPSSRLARELSGLAASLEGAPITRPLGVSLPYQLGFEDCPHWPTEIAAAAIPLS